MPESAKRYALYVSGFLHQQIKLSNDGSTVSFDHLIELLDWPPLGMIIKQFFQSEQGLALLNDAPTVLARQRLELVACLIDSVAETLLTGDITCGAFAQLLTREEKFVQLLDHLAPADVSTTHEKRERYTRASAAIALRKQQLERYNQQRTRLVIFVEQFKKFREIGMLNHTSI